MFGGLQILPSGVEDEPDNWRWARPEPGCAIVNIGDSPVQWSRGLLRSVFHRVLYAPGARAAHERYPFGYFLKPGRWRTNAANSRRQRHPQTECREVREGEYLALLQIMAP